MNFVSLERFRHLFDREKISFETFLKKAFVRTSNDLIPLEQYIFKNKISILDVKLLFDNIENRNQYITNFYNKSLLPKIDFNKKPLSFPKPMKKDEVNNNSLVQYKNIIRNIHYKNILKDTTTDIENIPTFLNVLIDFYVNNIIDYKLLCKSSIHYIKNGRIGSVFSSYFFRASIMNPYVVYSLNESVLKGTRIFTPTLGWTSYCYGFLECREVDEYVGNDVIASVCEKTRKFAEKYYPEKKVAIYQSPSEKLLDKSNFSEKYKNHFDVVFFSPPYYRLELYPGKDQSTLQYKSYEEWLEKYWKKTIELCHYVLKKDGRLCYIISNYGSNSKINLLKDMNDITIKNNFKRYAYLNMYNKNVNVNANQTENTEKICIFIK